MEVYFVRKAAYQVTGVKKLHTGSTSNRLSLLSFNTCVNLRPGLPLHCCLHLKLHEVHDVNMHQIVSQFMCEKCLGLTYIQFGRSCGACGEWSIVAYITSHVRSC